MDTQRIILEILKKHDTNDPEIALTKEGIPFQRDDNLSTIYTHELVYSTNLERGLAKQVYQSKTGLIIYVSDHRTSCC